MDQENTLSKETISSYFKMLSFIPFELLEVQVIFSCVKPILKVFKKP